MSDEKVFLDHPKSDVVDMKNTGECRGGALLDAGFVTHKWPPAAFESPKLKVKLLHPDAKMPFRGPESSGLDLYACEDILLEKGQVGKIQTGIAVEMPPGYEGHIRPRSSMGLRGVVPIFGTIDPGYRGSLTMPTISFVDDYFVRKGDRVAQLVICPYGHFDPIQVEELTLSERGEGGFGSTGTR